MKVVACSWHLLLFLQCVALCTAVDKQSGEVYAEEDPASWARIARNRVQSRAVGIEQQAHRTAAREQIKSASALLARAEYAKAEDQVQDRSTINSLTTLEHDVQRQNRRDKHVGRIARRIGREARQVERELQPTMLGEARQQGRFVRAAEMKGNAARWQREGNRWAAGADKVKAALDESAESAAVAATRSTNDAILAAKQNMLQHQQQQQIQYESAKNSIQLKQQQRIAAQKQRLSTKLSKMRMSLERTEREASEQHSALTQLTPSIKAIQQLTVQARDEVGTEGATEAQEHQQSVQLAAAAEQERPSNTWPATEQQELEGLEDATASGREQSIVAQTVVLAKQLAPEPQIVKNELEEAAVLTQGASDAAQLQQVDAQLQGAELAAGSLEAAIEHQSTDAVSRASDAALLGEAITSPRTDLLSLTKAQHALKLEQQNQAQVESITKMHNEMKLEAVATNTKIRANGELGQLRNQLKQSAASVQHAKKTLARSKDFAQKVLVPKLRVVQQRAKATAHDEDELVDLSNKEMATIEKLRVERTNLVTQEIN